MTSAVHIDSPPAHALRTWTREEFERLIGFGLFGDEKLELLEGNIITMSPQGIVHASVNQLLTKRFVRALGDRAEVRVQLPFAAGDLSRPEPDVAIVPPGDYVNALPTLAYLLVEVAESSLDFDRTTKARLYAACNIPEYWIINLVNDTVEVYTEPLHGDYGSKRTYRQDERIGLSALSGIGFDVNELLPQR